MQAMTQGMIFHASRNNMAFQNAMSSLNPEIE